jgi:OmcA/MtrC family decaheme c-type cytochrome
MKTLTRLRHLTLDYQTGSVPAPAGYGKTKEKQVKSSLTRWGTAALVAFAMAGCGGDGGSSPPVPVTLADAIRTAAADPANDASTNSSASFAVLQSAGTPAVVAGGSPVKVNFTVFSGGAVVQNIKLLSTAPNKASFAIAKLVPPANGNPHQWVNYVSRIKTTTATSTGPAGQPPAMASAVQGTTDPYYADATALAGQLVYNADGYYTYSFQANIKDPAWTAKVGSTTYKTNGVVFEPNSTHRIAIQLQYTDASGTVIKVNPYFDVTFDSSGNSVAVTDPTKTFKMTDVSSCNGCHEKLALHGGGRVDTQFCVMCHNPGTTDPVSGNVVTLSTMVHSIHSGKLLAAPTTVGGVDYYIGKDDYAEVGFPQDLRNCARCHSAANTATPQGDNWKKVVSKEACLTCHANNAGSDWDTSHTVFAQSAQVTGTANPAAKAKDLTNAQCATCHAAVVTPGKANPLASESVHWNQNEENAAKYKMNIESVTYSGSTPGTTSTVTVQYYLADPTNNNAAYDLQTSDNGTACTGSGATLSCGSSTKFGNLRFYLAYQNMKGQSTAVTEWSSYNNGGSGANAYAYKGTNIGGNHYTVAISVPPDTTYTAAFGTARVITIGQVKEVKLDVKSDPAARKPVVPTTLINTVVQHTYKDVALTGALQPRREIVSSAKCNVCHGALGTTSGSNTLAEAFHSGARNTVEACSVCHDANRVSSTVMTSGNIDAGVGLNEAYQMKRMIHGIHGNSKRTYPFTHGNVVVGAFDQTGKLTTAGSFLADYTVKVGTATVVVVPAGTAVASGTTFDGIAQIIDTAARNVGYTGTFIASAENYAAEVAYPQVGLNCNACHVNNSYKQDLGPLGAVVSKAGGNTSDPTTWKVISPKAASCTACHDSPAAQGHVVSFGGARFGSATQAAIAGLPRESCDDCHSPGAVKGVDLVHGQK